LGTEIDSVADVLEREKEIIASAEASKKDAEQNAVDAEGDELAALHQKIREYTDEIETASQVIEEAEAMKSSAEAHIAALAEAEEQKTKLKDAVRHQVNVTTSNFTAELAKLLHRADHDPLTACLNKVTELDEEFAALLDSGVNGSIPPNGTSFHIALRIDPSRIKRPFAPDLASFGHFAPKAELDHNATGTESGAEHEGGAASGTSGTAAAHATASAPEQGPEAGEKAEGDNVWLTFWPTSDSVALVEKKRCRAAVENLEHKYNVNVTAFLGYQR
jgi:hypothetical protein